MHSMVRVCALGLAVGTSACGGGGYSGAPGSPTAPSAPSTPGAVTITITGQNGGQSFSPNPATAGGQMVVFRNSDSIVHRVVLNDLSIDTGNIAPGATSQPVQMPVAGTNYHCSLHAGMVGAISGGSGDPPACEGPYCSGYY
jgi:plastocyanin